MANEKTTLDTIEVKDLEDGSKITVTVQACTELGNKGVPGIQVHYLGYIVNYEPIIAERWAYQARKANKNVHFIEDNSWNVHPDQFIRNYLVLGTPPRARVEVKTRSKAAPVVKEYPLPFNIEE
jgi:hypothetical protein